MVYVLAPAVGAGTGADPYRVDNVVGSIVWMRHDPPKTVGWGLARLIETLPGVAVVPVGATELGPTLDHTPARQTTRDVESKLGLKRDALAGLTVRRIFEDLCVVHKTKKLQAGHDRKYRILADTVVSEWAEVAGGATQTDLFDRADSTNMGPDWEELLGDWEILTNAAEAVAQGNGGAFLRHTADLASDNHYAQVDRVTGTFNGVYARWGSAAGSFEGYFGRFRSDTTVWQLYRVSGTAPPPTFTLLGELAEAAPASPWTLRVTPDGSTITVALVTNGATAVKVTATDTTYLGATHRRSGIAGGLGRWDNFQASDLAGPQTVAVGVVADSEVAQPIAAAAGAVTVAVGVVGEVETVVGVDPASTVAVAVAAAIEADTATAITPTTAVVIPVAAAADVDTVVAVGAAAAAPFTSPTGLTAVGAGPTSVDLAWNAVTGATGYDIERDGVIIAHSYVGTSFTDTGLTAATGYQYRVRAVR